jgi:hypothetical protein
MSLEQAARQLASHQSRAGFLMSRSMIGRALDFRRQASYCSEGRLEGEHG